MPSENVIKEYKSNSFYHVYNRGVEKRSIFKNSKDRDRFLSYVLKAWEKSAVSIAAYCLMKNHYHFLLFQEGNRSMVRFMHSLATAYTCFFNHKYHRVGSLFQGTYKARLIRSDEDLLNTSVYIHKNPYKVKPGLNLKRYHYSSYPYYIGKPTPPKWLDISLVKDAFVVDKYSYYVESELG